MKQSRNGVAGIPRKCLEEKAETLASQGEWVSFINVLALLVFGTVLFPNIDELMDLVVIDAFLAYYHSKESSIIVVLAYAYDTFGLRCEKSSARIVCCMPTLYVWLVSHVFNQGSRFACPLQGHSMCSRKDKANWEELLAGMMGASISWFPWCKEGGARVLCSCEGFPNVPLIRTRGCINYNPVLAIRQLGYPMKGAPSEETIVPSFNEANTKILQRIRKAWDKVGRKDKELRGRSNGVIGGYHKWFKPRTQGITWLQKLKGLNREESEEVQALKAELKKTRVENEKLKVAVTRVRKECDKLKDINMTVAEALEWETKKDRKEEWSKNKF